MDRVEREPRYKRRWLYYGAALYGFGLVAGVTRVLSGDASPVALLGVPIPSHCLGVFAGSKAGKNSSQPMRKSGKLGTMSHFSGNPTYQGLTT